MKRQPHHSVTRQIERARGCAFRGDIDEAAAILDSLARRHGRVPAVWIELSRVDRLQGRKEAAEHARRAYELAPDDAQTLRELALALAEDSARMSDAVAAAERAVIVDGTDAANWATLASICLADDNLNDAAAASRKALELDAFCVDAHLVLADTALATGDVEEAARCFRVALNLAPELQEIADAPPWLEYLTPVNGSRRATPQVMAATLDAESLEDGGAAISPGTTSTGPEDSGNDPVAARNPPPEPFPARNPFAAPEAYAGSTRADDATVAHPTDEPGETDLPVNGTQAAGPRHSVAPHAGTSLNMMSGREFAISAETSYVQQGPGSTDPAFARPLVSNEPTADHEPAVTTGEDYGPPMRGPSIDSGSVTPAPVRTSEPSMTRGQASPPAMNAAPRDAELPYDGGPSAGEQASTEMNADVHSIAAATTAFEHMNQAVLNAVLRHVEAFNARDTAALIDGFSEDAVLRTGPDLVVGHAQLREVFGDAFDEVDSLELVLRSAVVQNGTAACELTERVDVDGERFISEFVGIYTVHYGRIVRARIYREGE